MLKIKYLGFCLENPCILASASPTSTVEMIENAFEAGWAGAVIKTVVPENIKMVDVSNRFAILRNSPNSYIGFENVEQLSKKNHKYWLDGIAYLKQKYPTKMLILSVMADISKESWQKVIEKFTNTAIDAFELNFSCPHMRRDEGMGVAIGQDSDLAAGIVKWVKEVSTKPIIVKLTPNLTSTKDIVEKTECNGADAFAAINTVLSVIGVDIDTLQPKPCVNGYTSFGGYSGPAIKPIGLRIVSEVYNQTKKPIFGIGGISTWRDVIEYLAVGASAVQICTEVMVNGVNIIKKIINGLNSYVAEKKLNSLEDIIGAANQRIVSQEALPRNWRKKSVCIREKCVLCKKCIIACSENTNNAIRIVDNQVIIDETKCDGCALCTLICPTNALYLK